jgi:pimeloyl-ACP methyl ester carboxylesterase
MSRSVGACPVRLPRASGFRHPQAVANRLREVLSGPQSVGHLPDDVPGRLIKVHGHTVHVVERGSGGEAILLVHGTAGTTLDWEQAADALSDTHRVVALDLFGMGFSERIERCSYGFSFWADQLGGTLDVLGVRRASVIGQSLGGGIAAFFAGTFPSRVERVVSVDSGPWMPPLLALMLLPGVGELMLSRVEYWPDRPDQGERYAERLRHVYRIKGTRRHLMKAMRGQFLHPRSYFQALSKIECPVLLVHGANDDIIPLRAAKTLQRRLAGSRMVVLEGAGHFAMQDQPGRFIEEVRRFLAARL